MDLATVLGIFLGCLIGEVLWHFVRGLMGA